MPDGSGDRMVASLDKPLTPRNGAPLVMLIHGLTGCQDSYYVLNSTLFWLRRGHSVLRLNLRGAGPSRPLCGDQYHAGRSADLRAVLAALDPQLLANGVVAIGYSLGGNVLLKFLGEEGENCDVKFAATVSAPLDLAATSKRFHRARNRIYLRWLLSRMKQESLAPGAHLSEAERTAIKATRSVWAFDEVFVAPRNGYAGAMDYYERCSGGRFLGHIFTPTLLIHSLDDPWIPADAYVEFDDMSNPCVTVRLSKRGGHVGFHGRGSPMPWHDQSIGAWLDRLWGLKSGY